MGKVLKSAPFAKFDDDFLLLEDDISLFLGVAMWQNCSDEGREGERERGGEGEREGERMTY